MKLTDQAISILTPPTVVTPSMQAAWDWIHDATVYPKLLPLHQSTNQPTNPPPSPPILNNGRPCSFTKPITPNETRISSDTYTFIENSEYKPEKQISKEDFDYNGLIRTFIIRSEPSHLWPRPLTLNESLHGGGLDIPSRFRRLPPGICYPNYYTSIYEALESVALHPNTRISQHQCIQDLVEPNGITCVQDIWGGMFLEHVMYSEQDKAFYQQGISQQNPFDSEFSEKRKPGRPRNSSSPNSISQNSSTQTNSSAHTTSQPKAVGRPIDPNSVAGRLRGAKESAPYLSLHSEVVILRDKRSALKAELIQVNKDILDREASLREIVETFVPLSN